MFNLYDKCERKRYELVREKERLKYAPKYSYHFASGDTTNETQMNIGILEREIRHEDDCTQLKQLAMVACNVHESW